VASAKRQTGP